MSGLIKTYSGIDRETYLEVSKLSQEKIPLTKKQIIEKVENASNVDGSYSKEEKDLVNDLKEKLTDKNNTLEIQSSKIDPKSHKINFSMAIKGERGLLNKGLDAVSNGISSLDIPYIKDNKAIAKEEVMNNINSLANETASSYISSKFGEGTLSISLKNTSSFIGIVAGGTLATGVDLVPDNLLSVVPTTGAFVSKTFKATKSATKGGIVTNAISGGKTTPKDFRFIGLSYKDEEKIAKAYQLISESKTDVKAICTNLRNDKDLSNPAKIEKIKNYLFNNKEFQPDPDIAMAWNRLRTGAGNEVDKILLKHESLEISIREANPSMGYKEAHEIANKTYDWSNALDSFNRGNK